MAGNFDPREIGDDPTIAAPGPADLPTRRAGLGAAVRVKAGDAVGPYLLVEEVGSGGFGVVRRAEQRVVADRRAGELERVSASQAARLRAIDPPAMGATIREAIIASASEGERLAVEAALARINLTDIALRSLAHDVFAPTIAAVETEFLDQPLVRARLLRSVAGTLPSLGLTRDAVAPQDRALALRRGTLGGDHPDTLFGINNAAG